MHLWYLLITMALMGETMPSNETNSSSLSKTSASTKGSDDHPLSNGSSVPNGKSQFNSTNSASSNTAATPAASPDYTHLHQLRVKPFLHCPLQENNTALLMLKDLWVPIASQLYHDFQVDYNYVDHDALEADIVLEFYETHDSERGYPQVDYCSNKINFQEWEPTATVLQENFLFLIPSMLVTLIKKVVFELLFTSIVVFVPWVLLNANVMALILHNQTKPHYLGRLLNALKLLVGNKKTNTFTLVYRSLFLFATLMIASVIMTDFLYIVGTTIIKENFQSINELIMRQMQVCIVEIDHMMTQIFARYRYLTYTSSPSIQGCIDYIMTDDSHTLFIGEFLFGSFLSRNAQYNNRFKYTVRNNFYKSYSLLANTSLPLWFREGLNNSILAMQNQKTDLKVRQHYLVPVLYERKQVASLISSNSTFLLASICISFLLMVFINISMSRRQWNFYINDIPFRFKKEKPHVAPLTQNVELNLESRCEPTLNIPNSMSNIFAQSASTEQQQYLVENENVVIHAVARQRKHK